MAESKKYTVKLVQEGEDLILPFSEEMLELVGWKIGDKLVWEENDDGTWTISKVDGEPDDPLEGMESTGC